MLSTYLSIVNAVEKGDVEYIELIARCIDMGDAAKQVLRDKGYGWTGLDLLKTCELVREHDEDLYSYYNRKLDDAQAWMDKQAKENAELIKIIKQLKGEKE